MSAINRRAARAASAATVSTAAAAPNLDAALIRMFEEQQAAWEENGRALRAEDAAKGAEKKRASAAVSASWDRWEEIASEIASTPALGFVGIAVKMRMVMNGMRNGFARMEEQIAESLFEDAHRLAGIPILPPPPEQPDDPAIEPWQPPAWMLAGNAEGARLTALGLPREGGFTMGDITFLTWLLARVAAEMGEDVAAKVRDLSTMNVAPEVAATLHGLAAREVTHLNSTPAPAAP